MAAEAEQSSGKPMALVVLVFLALAALILWWLRVEEDGERAGEIVMGSAEIEGEPTDLQLEAGRGPVAADRARSRREEMQRLCRVLLAGADLSQRRSAALRLQYLADDSAEEALRKGLLDEDGLVSRRCAKALESLWQQSDSASVNRLFQQGLAACEAGRYDEALERFEMCVQLDPDIADLYRLRAEILLETGRPEEAVRACREALRREQHHFLAHYVLARCHMDLRDGDAALDSVNRALEIYPDYPAALQLKVEILSLQKAGEL